MHKINVEKGQNVDLRVYVDGKKFNCAKDSISSGEHVIDVKNVIYLTKRSAFLWMIVDFLRAIFGGLIFGELFERQGSTLYRHVVKGKVEGDIDITVDDTVCVNGLSEAETLVSSKEEQPKVARILRRYNFVCGTVFAATALIILAAVVVWGILAGRWLF